MLPPQVAVEVVMLLTGMVVTDGNCSCCTAVAIISNPLLITEPSEVNLSVMVSCVVRIGVEILLLPIRMARGFVVPLPS